MLVELKNGETLNGHLVTCDNFMNLILREVVQTSPEGDRFFKLPEVYIRGNNVSLQSYSGLSPARSSYTNSPRSNTCACQKRLSKSSGSSNKTNHKAVVAVETGTVVVGAVVAAAAAVDAVGDEAVTKHEPFTMLSRRQMRYPGGDGKVARRSGTV